MCFKSLAGQTAGWGKVQDMMETARSPERQNQVGAASSQRPTQRTRKPTQSTAPAPHFWDDISVQDQGRRNRTFYQRYMVLTLEECGLQGVWKWAVSGVCNSKINRENFLSVLVSPRPKSLKFESSWPNVPDGWRCELCLSHNPYPPSNGNSSCKAGTLRVSGEKTYFSRPKCTNCHKEWAFLMFSWPS